ncbi:MAG TPA: fibronectin type III domain-containing protein, partial [Solirubrobacteraceae bacterium]
ASALALVALGASAPVASSAKSAGGSSSSSSRACAGRTPRDLRLTRLHGSRARLSWKAPKGASGAVSYRVKRSGRTVGQTTQGSIVVRVTPGRVVTLSVSARSGVGSAGCWSKLRSTVAFHGPGRVAGLRIVRRASGRVTLAWKPATRGDAPIAGYRVERDAAVVGQTHARSFVLKVSSGRTHRVSVAAVDTRGHLGPASNTLVLAGSGTSGSGGGPTVKVKASTTHIAPNAPPLIAAERVTDTSATLSWQAGSANGGTLTGYLLYEDGAPVGVIHGQSATVTLASQREYTFTVRALDSLGYLSAPAPSVTVVTTHTPPPAPTGLTAGEVTSTSAHLSWAPSTAVSGDIVGYRVFRDGVPVGEAPEPQMTLASLAPSSDYEVTVTAVDSLGAISEPTPALVVHTADPTPTSGTAQAFLLASTDQSFHDLQAHYRQIGVVYPTYFNCAAGGQVTGSDDPLVTGWAVARKIEVLPRLNCQNLANEEQILNQPAARAAEIENLAALCRTYGYQGIQVDFEDAPPSDRAPFTAFITALAEKLHAQGDKLSTIVTAKYYNVMTGRAAMYDDAALSAVSDYLFVTDWGLHWTTSTPGSIDEYGWFKRVAEYTATLPNRSKFVLGMPMYGIDWPNGGGSGNPGTPLEYEDIVALETVFGALPEWDATALSPHFTYHDGAGVRHDVWFTDKQSIGARTALAASLGLKIGLWHLGSEDQGVWELPQ